MASNETAKRRQRVHELWGKPDRLIAETLLAEGFTVDRENPRPASKAARAEWQASGVDSMRRNVTRDRDWWRSKWRKRATVPKATDFHVAREEHIAALESDLGDIHELIEDGATKTTAKAMLIGERRQTRALLAKARGVEEITPVDPEGEKAETTVVGILIGTENVSPEMRERLRAQGVLIGDEAA